MFRNLFLPLIMLVFVSCGSNFTPEEIINKTIEYYGGDLYRKSKIEFDFRGTHYSVQRNKGLYRFERTYNDSTNTIREYNSSKGVFKEINGNNTELSEKDKNRIGSSINSVAYFASLPYPLNDKAAVKKLLGTEEHENTNYYLIEVTFRQTGGGDDHNDRYIYWINSSTFQMDYFAYYFFVNGGGSRFRVVGNERKINGIILTDHENYKSDSLTYDTIENYLKLFKKGELEKVSEILLENPGVTILE